MNKIIGSWSSVLKYWTAAAVFLFILLLGYLVDVRQQRSTLKLVQEETGRLQHEFVIQQRRMVSSNKQYRELEHIKKTLNQLLHQMPSVQNLNLTITNIFKFAETAGINCKLFKLMPAHKSPLYTAFPIDMIVVGSYPQISKFLKYLVTANLFMRWNNFSLYRETASENAALVLEVRAELYLRKNME